MTYDCIIIGGGPAGITAAVQLKRSGLNVILIEKGQIGGLLRNAKRVENYLGFPDGISGEDLVEEFQNQLEKWEVSVVEGEVLEVMKSDQFEVKLEQKSYTSKTVIVATGTKPRHLEVMGEQDLIGKKVFYEVAEFATAPSGEVLDFSLGKRSPAPQGVRGGHSQIIVVGGGDAGFDYAINLHDRGHLVTLVTRGKRNCLPLLNVEAAERGVEVHEQMRPQEIIDRGERVVLDCGDSTFEGDYILVAIGREPQMPKLPEDMEGLFVAGDVTADHYRQVHIATGEALKVAMGVAELLGC